MIRLSGDNFIVLEFAGKSMEREGTGRPES